MISSLRKSHPERFELHVASRAFLRIFTDAANHIPRHRRTGYASLIGLSSAVISTHLQLLFSTCRRTHAARISCSGIHVIGRQSCQPCRETKCCGCPQFTHVASNGSSTLSVRATAVSKYYAKLIVALRLIFRRPWSKSSVRLTV